MDHNIRTAGLKSRKLLPFLNLHPGQFLADLPDLSAGDYGSLHIGPVCPGLLQCHRRQGGKGSSGSDPVLRQHKPGELPQFFIQNFRRGNLYRLHIFFLFQAQPAVKPHRAHLAGECAFDPRRCPDGNFRTAAADINHSAAVRGYRGGRAEETELRFFLSADNPQRNTRCLLHRCHELRSVSRVPGRAGCEDSQFLGSHLSGIQSHSPDRGYGFVHAVPVQVARLIQAGKQACSLTVPPDTLEPGPADVCQQAPH